MYSTTPGSHLTFLHKVPKFSSGYQAYVVHTLLTEPSLPSPLGVFETCSPSWPLNLLNLLPFFYYDKDHGQLEKERVYVVYTSTSQLTEFSVGTQGRNLR